MRFIHTADWQIGMTRHYLDADAQARFSDARNGAIRRVALVAREQDAAFVVVAGDVFETNLLRPRTVKRALDAMGEIPVPVYLLPGNHDHLGPVSIYGSSEFLRNKPDNVFVLDSEEVVSVADGIEVVGIPWTAKQMVEDRTGQVIQALPPTSTPFRIAVAHGSTAAMGGAAALSVIDADTVDEAIQQGKLHYLALGDRHSTTSVGSTGRIWYAGAPEPTDYDEVDAGNVLVVDLEPGTVTVTPVHIGTWHFVEATLDIEPETADNTLQDFLAELPDKDHTIVKVNVRGTIRLLDQMRLESTVAEQRESFAAIERHEHHDQLAVLPESGGFDDLVLSGYAKEAFDQLVTGASSADPEGQRYRDALALLYRLAKEAQ